MCGICGFIGEKNKDLIEEMTRTITHRGPDQDGFFLEDTVSFGHRRLSIIDLSSKGRQPLFSEDKKVAVIFNGEIYNFKKLREELEKKGHKFISQTDGEVIVHLYEEEGENFVQKLRGMFAIALWDRKEEKLILVRDRIGIKPLYYFCDGKNIYFASEMKALFKNLKVNFEISEDSYFHYLAFGYTPTQKTILKTIQKLPPAHLLIYKNGQLTLKKYWDLPKTITEKISEDEACKNILFLLKESIRLHLVADVPLGVLLSGGLDSSVVVALAAQESQKPLKTFSVGFGEKSDELPYAKLVASRYKTDHHEFLVKTKDLTSLFEKIVYFMDEPLADGGAGATYLVSEMVKKEAKVLLVGEGGDELFGGYSWHKLASKKILPETLRLKIYFYLNTFYRGKNKREIYENFKKIFWESAPENSDFLQKMTAFEIKNLLPNSLLMKVDKMTMAHSLEARVPFLDHKLLEYVFSLPQNLKLKNSQNKQSLFFANAQNKYLLRQIASSFLPEEIIKRKKHGFIIPMQKWLFGELKNQAQDLLFSQKSFSQNFFTQKELENLFVKTRNPFLTIEKTAFLWRLFLFELWYKIYP